LFHPDRELYAIILNILKSEGKSISAISRELEKMGFKFHRLILTGYLRALTDMNFLKEKEVPPAKIYLPAGQRKKDIYEMVGEKCRSIMGENEEADELVLYCLARLFRRAIFADELKRSGVTEGLAGHEAGPDERLEARRVLTRSGFKIATSQKAYLPDMEFHEEFVLLLEELVQEKFDLSHLVRETKQTKLNI